MLKRIFGIGLTAWMLSGAAHAQMAESLKSEYHSSKDLGATIVTPADVDKLDSLMRDPGVKVLCLQLSPPDMNEARARALLTWVRTGKTLWIYDPRLGPWFGFEPALMEKKQFTNKPESGTLGGKKVEGVATVALAFASHALNTGVGQVSLFLPKLDDQDHFGGVWVKGDTIGLLRFKIDSPALAALRREGHGAIFYKPLLWPEVLSGDRFQANVLEYSAGYQIPGPAGEGLVGTPPGPNAEYVEGKPAVPLLQGAAAAGNASTPSVANTNGSPAVAVTAANVTGHDRVETSSEGVLVGRITDETFLFETGSQSLKLPRKEVKQIKMGGNLDLDSLQTWDGQTRKGMLIMHSIKVNVAGDEKTVLKKNLQRIDFEQLK